MRRTIVLMLVLALLLSPAACADLDDAATSPDTALLRMDQAAHTISLSRPITLRDFRTLLGQVDPRTCRVYNDTDEIKWELDLVTAGTTAVLSGEDRGNMERYSVVSANLFSGKTIKASSCEKGSMASKATDGSAKTRWTAYNNHYPQSITVDLGSISYLDTLTIHWLSKSNRHYSYTVEVSEDGADYVLAVDRSENRTRDETCDHLRWIEGRYVRINILSCSDRNGYASIVEMNLDGWSISPEDPVLDYENKLLFLPASGQLIRADLGSYLSGVSGAWALPVNGKAVTLREGSQVHLIDLHGRKTLFTCTTQTDARPYAGDAALFKPVFCSSQEKLSRSGGMTYAYNVNDGDGKTAWVAGETVKGRYGYPEWVCIDLEGEYSLSEIELQFETKNYRVYQFQVYASSAKPPVSQEELPADYRLIADLSDNLSYDNGHYRISLEDQTARYVAVKVLGNTLYPSTLAAAAGIYDLKVFGIPGA